MRRFVCVCGGVASQRTDSVRRGASTAYTGQQCPMLATGLGGFAMPADGLWVSSVVCRLVCGRWWWPYLTASNDVHAAVANPRTKPGDPHASTPVLPPAGQASRRPQGVPNSRLTSWSMDESCAACLCSASASSYSCPRNCGNLRALLAACVLLELLRAQLNAQSKLFSSSTIAPRYPSVQSALLHVQPLSLATCSRSWLGPPTSAPSC